MDLEKRTRLREQVDTALGKEEYALAQFLLNQLWRTESGPSCAAFVLSRVDRMPRAHSGMAVRLAVLRSFTIEPLIPIVRAAAALNGIDLTVHVGDFNTYVQDILDANSALYRFEPGIVVLAVQTRDVAPNLWDGFSDLSASGVETEIARVTTDYRSWIHRFRERSQAHLVLHGLECPQEPALGVFDGQTKHSQTTAIQEINSHLRGLAHELPGVYFLDYDGLVSRFGRSRWHDEHKWLTARMPVAADCLVHLADEWLRFIHPLVGKICKVLITDLDNILWGGIVGEDGLSNIQVGREYPGAAYWAVQRALLDLHHRGILLAICSKNNPAEALDALENHPGMLLRRDHFAAMRINWNDKTQNLREIAVELGIGTDALAFLDDNPAERERVRVEMPEVTVIELPKDSMRYAETIRECPVFERLTLSAEDRNRSSYYVEQRQRAEVQQTATSLEDFYRTLAQEVEIAPVTAETMGRVAQLTQKTNQFNLTTRRYNEQQIHELAKRQGWGVYSIRVRDRFGDNGLVGAAITHIEGELCTIENFLLSCRVIGRSVEMAALSFLIDRAQGAGAKEVQGWFSPTRKNAPAAGFYPTHGFSAKERQENSTLWTLDLSKAQINCPDWIRLSVVQCR